jgi:hypothetical protein
LHDSLMTPRTMRTLGRVVLPLTAVLALLNVVLGGVRVPLVIWEVLVVVNAWMLSCYWCNRAEGNAAEYISIEVSERWDGDPEQADFGVLIVTIATVLFPFGWILFERP